MRPPFRSEQEVIINAPLETVWAFNMDITKIPTRIRREHDKRVNAITEIEIWFWRGLGVEGRRH